MAALAPTVLAPVDAWRPWMVWVWSGQLDESAIRLRAVEIATRGYAGVVLRVGLGCAPAWNTPEFHALLRTAIAACREHKLQVWLGDDGPGAFHVPSSASASGSLLLSDNGAARSGSAGGRTAREWPDLRGHILRVATQDLGAANGTSGGSAEASLKNWSVPLAGPGLLLSVAVPRIERKLDFSRALPLLDYPEERRGTLIARLQRESASEVRVLSFAHERGGYIDLFSAQSASAFIQLALEPLRDGLGESWAWVQGLWLQQPSLRASGMAASTSPGARGASGVGGEMFLPWSPAFAEEFQARRGYDLLEWLPALVADQGDMASRVRQDFWRVATDLEHGCFIRPLHTWARAHGKKYGGSTSHPQPINAIVSHAGDLWPHYSTLDAPAVDAPGLQAGGDALDLNRGLQARLVASIVALRTPENAGQPSQPAQVLEARVEEQVLAEVGRGAGWGATLGERVHVWHHLLRQGATQLIEHGGFQSWRDDAPLATAPSLLHQPWRQASSTWSDYTARLGWALSRGRSGARVGLLWPVRSVWAHHHPRGHRFTRWVEEDLHATALMLDDLHFEFLFTTEELLLEGAIESEGGKGVWKCGAARHPFEMIVLPSVTAMDRALWSKLEAFIESGGQVACLGLLPRYSERGRDEQFEQLISRATMLTVGDLYESYAAFEDSGGQSTPLAGYPITRDTVKGGRLSCYQPRLNDSVRDALLRVRKLLKENMAPEFETQAPDILYTRRILSPDEDLLPPVPASSASSTRLGEPVEEEEDEQAAPDESESSGEDDFSWDRPYDWNQAPPARPQVLEGTPQSAEEPGASESESEASEDDLPTWNEVTVRDKRMELPPLRGGELFWVFNTGEMLQRANVRLRPAQDSSPHRIDAWSGEVTPIAVYTRFSDFEGGGLSVSLELAPGEAALLWAQPVSQRESQVAHIEAATWTVEAFDGRIARGYATEGGPPRTAIRQGEKGRRVEGESIVVPPPLLLPDAWQSARSHPNVWALEAWQWQRGRHLPSAQKKLFGREQWVTLPDNGSPGADASGILSFRTRFEAAEVPPELFLPLPPLGVPCDLFLGDDLLDVAQPEWSDLAPFNDPGWTWFDLSPLVRPGQNTLTCVVDRRERAPSESHAGSGEAWTARAPVVPRLVGDFGVTIGGALTSPPAMVLSSGSWHAQGLPFYVGGVDLRQWIRAAPEWNRCRVFLELSDCRDAVGLWLNERYVGVRLCPPYRFDVSRFLLKNASNEVRLRVWNTSHPFFEPRADRLSAGLLGPARFVAYPILTPIFE